MQLNKNTTFLNPYELVSEFDLSKGDSVADFGSGAGHFVLAMARIVGQDGTVNAIDIRTSMLEVLDGHAKLEDLRQIKIIQGNTEKKEGSTLPDRSQDLVLISNTLHQSKDPSGMIKEAMRVLKDGGKLFIVDWVENAPIGPPKRVPSAHAEKLAIDAGLVFEGKVDAGSTHYALKFHRRI